MSQPDNILIMHVTRDGKRVVLEGEGLEAGARYRAGLDEAEYTLTDLAVACVDGNVAIARIEKMTKPNTPQALLYWPARKIEE